MVAFGLPRGVLAQAEMTHSHMQGAVEVTVLNDGFLTMPGGVIGAVVNLVIAALVILIAGKALKGLTVDGFGGALLAALAIAAIYWLLNVLAASMVPAA